MASKTVKPNAGAPSGGVLNESQVPAINAASTSVERLNDVRKDAVPEPWTVLMGRNEVFRSV